MSLLRSLRIFTLAGICLLAFSAGTVLSAQDELIHACVHSVTGEVRVVASSEPCRPSESPLTWSAGKSKVLTDGVVAPLGTTVTKTLSVPSLGSVGLSCSAAGEAIVTFVGDLRTTGHNQFGRFALQAEAPATLATSSESPMTTAWVENANGLWKIDSGASGGTVQQGGVPCQAAVTITTITTF
jgi:hypothetical protein